MVLSRILIYLATAASEQSILKLARTIADNATNFMVFKCIYKISERYIKRKKEEKENGKGLIA